MRFRKLRIAWSVCAGLAAVLLILLWVRSYSWSDTILCMKHSSGSSWFGTYESDSSSTTVTSELGTIKLCWEQSPDFAHDSWEFRSETTDRPIIEKIELGYLGLKTEMTWYGRLFAVSHQTFLLVAVLLTAAPWLRSLRWRFSLRTLLIATTLVAVVLGLIVAVLRWPAG